MNDDALLRCVHTKTGKYLHIFNEDSTVDSTLLTSSPSMHLLDSDTLALIFTAQAEMSQAHRLSVWTLACLHVYFAHAPELVEARWKWHLLRRGFLPARFWGSPAPEAVWWFAKCALSAAIASLP